MQYVYKYVDDSSRVVYVGITNNMVKRIYQHKKDKLKEIKNPVIYYFPVKYRADADMLETYLINHYNTGKYFNVAKTNKGEVSFFDICDKLPWTMFKGSVDESIKPFIVSDVSEKIYVEKSVVINAGTIDGKIMKFWEDFGKSQDLINERIDFEKGVIDGIQNLKGYQKYPFVVYGLYLHKKMFRCMELLKKHLLNKKTKNRLLQIASNINYEIEKHEMRR